MDLAIMQIIYQRVLILMRVTGLFIITPFYGSRTIPTRIRLGLALLITFILGNVLSNNNLELPSNLIYLTFDMLTEFSIGLVLGLIALLIFVSIQLAGQFMDMRMGFALANVMDPQNGNPSALTGQFKNILATLLFLVINGHHHLLQALDKSFLIIPLTKAELSNALFMKLLKIIGQLFPLAFKIALPLVAVLFLTDIAFGLVARAVPQINIFVVGLPTKILVGILLLSLTMPIYISLLKELFRDMFINMNDIINILGS
ncbi:flagellar biosynthetic protein FliR [Candidatus Frackibacter sp. WG12]|uniref:flagellar biosynthetic protein FliR n=1 Tax=unclassified Candidatus Frackibacter TaxID=2648818 RepID=UPI00079B2D99|nr:MULTISPECIES: flagellar biosynthetic protein FliR [unclassified Candidatus Frackibacter]KXS40615.1 MAG: flagellar biosynthetic protein FliR [Candidatus Frackibacter sp. T328-2]SDB99312.1 flagellar biosynthetic protein FliR [Candidatus Frackibacter sp. WG11]SEM30973.1 flagellar biosynthetic protein FliR [Candidatus Frackibacter sp. WG12]